MSFDQEPKPHNLQEKPVTVIPGYPSLFDHIPSVQDDAREALKQRIGEAARKVSEAWTIKDLHAATNLAIPLPPVDTEAAMRNNLNMLWKALDEMSYKDPRPETEAAYLFVDHQVMARYSSIPYAREEGGTPA